MQMKTEDGFLTVELKQLNELVAVKDLPLYQLKNITEDFQPLFFALENTHPDGDLVTRVRMSLPEISKIMNELLSTNGDTEEDNVIGCISNALFTNNECGSFSTSILGDGYSVKRKLDNNIFIHVFPFSHDKFIPNPVDQLVYKGEINNLPHLMMVRHLDYDITKYCKIDCQQYFAEVITAICPFSKDNFIEGIGKFEYIEKEKQ